ncbi:MAG: SDR family oxidoreductase [Eubacteriaceae bacterium]|jgi:acyl transferase domain-containing protein/NAD(P)-dependent dehydrogenase (short-subunit alcohol dehydrogenase family)|nr:SDR family oxidoreductase [Eubacteriaceae bacterium]
MKSEIAVIGMGGYFPGAMDVSEYWSNILSARDCTINIPDSYWDLSEFYDPNPLARDKTYGYRAGLMNYATFNSIEFGIPPRIMESICVDQLFALLVAKQALLDAGLIGDGAKQFNKEKAGVILSASVGKSSYLLSHRQTQNVEAIMKNSHVPQYLVDRVLERMREGTIEWNEASNPGYLPNVVAGRIGNRFDLNGTNCVVDAACAGSLASMKMAINELQCGDCDVVLTGGVMIDTTPFTFVAFSKTPAISPSNIARPFDKDSDGMLLGDGVGMLVIKRLADAERDNDHIYGVIESISSSSDGKAKSIFAPRKEGQTFALDRAYKDAGIDISTVGHIEAHGTGTSVGDTVELEALNEYVKDLDLPKKQIALGSVKSQIGHTRLAAGVASMIKTLFAVGQHTLPPTSNVTNPSNQLSNSAFYLSDKPRPWIVNKRKPLRRAGLSGFGFGGTNFHVIIREYIGPSGADQPFKRVQPSPSAIVLSAHTKEALAEAIQQAHAELLKEETQNASFNKMAVAINSPIEESWPRIAFAAFNVDDAIEKLEKASELLESQKLDEWHKNNIWYASKASVPKGAKVAFLYPGQGSQYAGMFTELTMAYRELQEAFSAADNALIAQGRDPVSEFAFPRLFPNEKPAEQDAKIVETANAQLSLAATGAGLSRILAKRGLEPDFLAGHSFGELAALHASGAMGEEDLMELAAKRAIAIDSAEKESPGAMLAVGAGWEQAASYIEGREGLFIANENSPRQTVVAGTPEAIKALADELSKKGVFAKELSVSGAFHSPAMKSAQNEFASALEGVAFCEPRRPVYANVTGKPYAGSQETAGSLAKQLVSPVRFSTSVSNMYESGARVFVEVGPGKVLTGLADQILENKPHKAVSLNPDKKQDSLYAFELACAQLKVIGIDIQSDPYVKPQNENYEPPPDNKRTYALPPLHFLLADTQQKIADAMNKPDPPLPPGVLGEAAPQASAAAIPAAEAPASALPAPKEAAQAEQPKAAKAAPTEAHAPAPIEAAAQRAQEKREEPKPEAPKPKAPSQPAAVMPPQPQKAAAKIETTEEAIEITQIEKGRIIMDNGDQTLPILESAYGLQALNKEMFTQFTQSQGMQLGKMKEIIEATGEAAEQNIGGMLQFMELFQSNSMQAYSAYFEEQSKLIASGAEGPSLSALPSAQPSPASLPPQRPAFRLSSAQPPSPPQLPEAKEEPPKPQVVRRQEPAPQPEEEKAYGFRSEAISVQAAAAAKQDEAKEPAKSAPKPQPAEPKAEPAPNLQIQAAPEPPAAIEAIEAVDVATGELIEAEVVGPATESIFVMGVTKNQIEERIIEVISDRTGYPVEMIEPDMNIESDLGIDSIRRVEIFSVLNDEIERGFTQTDIETMAGLYTIEEFSEFLEEKLNTEAPDDEETVHFDSDTINSFLTSGQVPEGMEIPEEYREMAEQYQQQSLLTGGAAEAAADEEEVQAEIIEPGAGAQAVEGEMASMPDAAIKRYDIYLKELEHPDPAQKPIVAESGLVLVTMDDAGVSPQVGEELVRRNYQAAYLNLPWQLASEGAYRLSSISEDAVASLLDALENDFGMPITGFVHIASPRYTEKNVIDIFDEREAKALETVFLFAKLFEGKCAQPADGKPFFMTVSRIDGMLGKGVDWNGASFQAGYAGLAKTLHHEYKRAFAKSIDIAHETTPQLAAEMAIEEIFAPEIGVYEVARDSIGNRYVNSLRENYDLEPSHAAPTESDVFFVTGGARGVTFRSALRIGLDYGSKLALVGHSRITQDLGWMNGETEPSKLRPLLIAKMREEGKAVQPKEVDATVKEALNQLEIQKNLAVAEKQGVKAIYICCDVRDEKSVRAAVSEAVSTLGPITGIIHGAGAIADKDISKKTSQDFHLVFDTKITGLYNCLKYIEPRELKYLAVFSSAAAYFGNEKQADYTLANEILNKFVNEFRKVYPNTFAMAINWGPWEGGMVSPALKSILLARNIVMVPYEQGSRMFADQFRYRFKEGHSQFLIHSTDQHIEHFATL